METYRFRHKPTEVDGVPISVLLAARSNGTMDKAPKWVTEAIFEQRLAFQVTAYGAVAYPLPNVPRVGAARDWVLHGENGEVNICPPEVLRDYYDMVDE